MSVSLTFYGATDEVTGSCYLLETDRSRVLLECGMHQGPPDVERLNVAAFPFPPGDIDAVVLSHAHLDHSGLLPRLVAKGFGGPVYCTRPTRGVASLILEDSGHLQEEQARYAAKKGYSRHREPKPLYTAKDAKPDEDSETKEPEAE